MANDNEHDEYSWHSQNIYRLLEPDYDYLSGEGTNYSEQDMEDNILKKVNAIPYRFETLYLDLDNLDDGGYLEGDSWRSVALDFFDIDEDDWNQVDGKRLTGGNERGFPEQTPARRLGGKFGRIADLLVGEILESDDRRLRKELTWGFIKTFYLPGPFTEPAESSNPNRELIEYIEQGHEAWLDRAEDTRQEFDQRKQVAQDMISHIINIFEQGEIDLPDVKLLSEGQKEQLAAKSVAMAFVHSWVVSSKENHSEEWREFMNQLDFNSFDVSSELTVAQIEHHLTEDGIREFLSKFDEVIQDSNRVLTSAFRNVELENVFRLVAENPGISSADIQQSMGINYRGGITRAARDLAGEERPKEKSGEVFSERPLVTGDRNGWELTEYGEVIWMTMSEPSESQPIYLEVDCI